MQTRILAIESSCDETSAAIIQDGKLLSNIIANQAVHEAYGGVVPKLASREHQKNISPVINQALKYAKISKKELNAIAFTKGHGLLGALLVRTSFAKGFALVLGIPLIEINHMQAHVLAHFIEEPKPKLPFICLTVSGRHTQFVLVQDFLDMEIIGETLDDAVGEAFDKTAKMLDLPYPGGSMIDKKAREGNPNRFQFNAIKVEGLNFYFSGVKTSILYFLKKEVKKNSDFVQENLANIAASVQEHLVEMLMQKLRLDVEQTHIKEVAFAGGVSANSALRKALKLEAKKNNWNIYIPKLEYCTDNAAMIAMAVHFKFLVSDFTNQKVSPLLRMKF